MKTFHHILRTTSAVILASLTAILVCSLGILVYSSYKGVIGIVAIVFFLVMGLYISHMIFKLVFNRGLHALGSFSKTSEAIEEMDEDEEEEDEYDDEEEDDEDEFEDDEDENLRRISVAKAARPISLQAKLFVVRLFKVMIFYKKITSPLINLELV